MVPTPRDSVNESCRIVGWSGRDPYLVIVPARCRTTGWECGARGPVPVACIARSLGSSMPREDAMSAANSNELNLRWIEAFNDCDWATEAACRTADYRAHVSGAPGSLDAAAWVGVLQSFTAAFRDARIAIEGSASAGISWRAAGPLRARTAGSSKGCSAQGDGSRCPAWTLVASSTTRSRSIGGSSMSWGSCSSSGQCRPRRNAATTRHHGNVAAVPDRHRQSDVRRARLSRDELATSHQRPIVVDVERMEPKG